MYGDTAQMRHDATRLRNAAEQARDDATYLTSHGSDGWVSTAAEAFADEVIDQAEKLRDAADQLEEAAAALEQHAQSVDEVKRAIAEAQRWISDRWNDAVSIAHNAVEKVVDGAGRVFDFFGRTVSGALVDQSHDIVRTIGELPEAGAKEWLDLAGTFRRNGWGG